ELRRRTGAFGERVERGGVEPLAEPDELRELPGVAGRAFAEGLAGDAALVREEAGQLADRRRDDRRALLVVAVEQRLAVLGEGIELVGAERDLPREETAVGGAAAIGVRRGERE